MVRKIEIVTIIFVLITCIFTSFSYASTPDEVVNEAQSFINAGQGGQGTVDPTKMQDVSSTIYNILLAVAVVVAVVVGAILGIQLMLASAEDKASVKEALIPFVVGCIVVFGAFGIWKLAVTLAQGIPH